jgi:DNA-binding response OmpR family regulator
MNTTEACQILLVEDDLRLANLIAEYLTGQGFKVHTETSGLRVARITADICPDLIILDISLPGKNGLQICQDIRGRLPRAHYVFNPPARKTPNKSKALNPVLTTMY